MTTAGGAATVSAVYDVLAFSGTIGALAIGFFGERDQLTPHLGDLLRVHVAERVAQTADGARVQLRHARFVDADLGADVLHRHFAVVVEADHLALAPGQRLNRGAHAIARLAAFVGRVGRLRLGRHQRRRQRALVHVLAGVERRRRLDGVDANDGAAQALLVGADAGGEIGHRRFVSQLAAQRFARGIQLAALTAHAARPRVLAQRVDHRAADAPLGEGLELDAAILIEAVGGVDQAEDAVLHEIADVDGVRHRGGHAPGQRLDKGQAGDDAAILAGGDGLKLSCLHAIATAVPTAQSVFQTSPLKPSSQPLT